MRLRIILLAGAISSMVLVSFLVPLALVLRNFAADRAVSTATVQAQWMTPLVATLNTPSLRLAVAQVNAESAGTPVTVFLPGGQELGAPAARTAGERLAASRGRSLTTQVPGGVEVLVAVEGLPDGTAVIRTFVPEGALRHGVLRAWLLLGCVGLGLLILSVAVADQLARSLVRPLTALARAADQLATGDLSARAQVAGPQEVRRAGAGLNRLAARIGELLARERETVADLSHRLRTPLTALRIDVESLRDSGEMAQLRTDVDAVERTVNEVIRAARRPTGEGAGTTCEANHVVGERAAFWRPLAEDTDRRMTVELAPGPVVVHAPQEDLAACVDILLENVFAHTPDGAAFAVRLSRRAGGGAWLVVSDEGPGFAQPDPAQRGVSSAGSTGLGLDIARRIAEESGGTVTIGRSPSGGGSVTVGLGPPPAAADRGHGRRRHSRLRRGGWLHRRAGRRPVPPADRGRPPWGPAAPQRPAPGPVPGSAPPQPRQYAAYEYDGAEQYRAGQYRAGQYGGGQYEGGQVAAGRPPQRAVPGGARPPGRQPAVGPGSQPPQLPPPAARAPWPQWAMPGPEPETMPPATWDTSPPVPAAGPGWPRWAAPGPEPETMPPAPWETSPPVPWAPAAGVDPRPRRAAAGPDGPAVQRTSPGDGEAPPFPS